jgi:hypothetical protein
MEEVLRRLRDASPFRSAKAPLLPVTSLRKSLRRSPPRVALRRELVEAAGSARRYTSAAERRRTSLEVGS